MDSYMKTATRTATDTKKRPAPKPALFQAPQGYMIEDQYPGTN